eukprot:9772004-Heterocapsa_arctica.AAC.1
MSACPLHGGDKKAWKQCTGLQLEIISEIWRRHAVRAEWGSINDGKAVSDRLSGNHLVDYMNGFE